MMMTPRWSELLETKRWRRSYDVPQIGSALACFLSPLHTEIKDWKEIEGVDEQEKG